MITCNSKTSMKMVLEQVKYVALRYPSLHVPPESVLLGWWGESGRETVMLTVQI